MIQVGVGLRSEHYEAAMDHHASIDFVEVHAENFFSRGGASIEVLQDITRQYPLSLHATSLGLGSIEKIPTQQIESLKKLVDRFSPILISDHACFSWIKNGTNMQHAGDLLPIPFSKPMLDVMSDNIKQVQDRLGRQILVENISSYLDITFSDMPEYEFFNQLCERSGCGLLLDLHNLYVNAINRKVTFPIDEVIKHIERTERDYVKEIHLAGIHNPQRDIWIDDHSGPVSDETWLTYQTALQRFGDVDTLIEWDTGLPSWNELVTQAQLARSYAMESYEYVCC